MSLNASIINGSLHFQTEPSTTPTPEIQVNQDQDLRNDLDPIDVSPGLEGFLVTFGVAVALVVLLVVMTRRLRRVKHAGGANQKVTATFDGEGPRLKGRVSDASSSTAGSDNAGAADITSESESSDSSN